MPPFLFHTEDGRLTVTLFHLEQGAVIALRFSESTSGWRVAQRF
jgi:hypothetical protein